MIILENKPELRDFLLNLVKKNLKIALIPTMGSIHKGHTSLIEMANKQSFFSIVTIFVNPTQFNDLNDYEDYPRNTKRDLNLLKKANTNLIFFPSNKDLYPTGIKIEKTILDYRDILCDKFRPDHFDGVTTVVQSLFNLINPDYAFFGEKDYQQLKLVQKMTEINNSNIRVYPCPSVRMKNGMSFSSRYNNFNLSQEILFNKSASIIMNALKSLRKKIDPIDLESIKKKINKFNIKKIDYNEIRDEINLLPSIKNNHSRLFIAYYIGDIRIIDNFILY